MAVIVMAMVIVPVIAMLIAIVDVVELIVCASRCEQRGTQRLPSQPGVRWSRMASAIALKLHLQLICTTRRILAHKDANDPTRGVVCCCTRLATAFVVPYRRP